MRIYTATNNRPDVASLWCKSIRATLQTPAMLIEAHAGEPVGCADECLQISDHRHANPLYVVRRVMPQEGERMFLEEDIIPVLPWSPDDYPGDLRFLDGHNGAAWPAFTIARTRNALRPYQLIPQRFVRDGGCPDWLPAELCQPALDADAKVVGSHFLHVDKVYRTPRGGPKDVLIQTLHSWFDGRTFERRPGLGDMVAAGLAAVGITPERVSAVTGRPCKCKERQAKLNDLGRRFGIG
jgi:hypothetical protein